jgi:hypothetical protein
MHFRWCLVEWISSIPLFVCLIEEHRSLRENIACRLRTKKSIDPMHSRAFHLLPISLSPLAPPAAPEPRATATSFPSFPCTTREPVSAAASFVAHHCRCYTYSPLCTSVSILALPVDFCICGAMHYGRYITLSISD